MKNNVLSTFVIKVMLYLIPLFAVWYYLAPIHLAPHVALTQVLFQQWLSDVIMWVKLQGFSVVVATHYGLNAAGAMVTPPVDEAAGFTLNPLSFGYGLPLLLALILATPTQDKTLKVLWGLIIISTLQWFSLIIAILKAVIFGLGSGVQQALGWSTVQLDLLAWLYQVGFLFLPMIAPLIIWALLCQDFIKALAPQWSTAPKVA